MIIIPPKANIYEYNLLSKKCRAANIRTDHEIDVEGITFGSVVKTCDERYSSLTLRIESTKISRMGR